MYPKICLLLLTFERRDYAERTLRSALENIRWPEPLSVHIADDGSNQEHRNFLYELAMGYSNVQGVSVTNAERGGYGKSYNLALQVVHQFAEFILPLEDDWELRQVLDLEPLVAALEEDIFGCIRMGYLGSTQPLRGEICYAAMHTYLRLDPASPEPHVWAGHPRLETREWQRKVGPWPEGLDPGSTEFSVACRKEAREGVVWPLDLIKPSGDLWHHIGTIQARVDQLQEAVV